MTGVKSATALLIACLMLAETAAAQVPTFDMSSERPAGAPPAAPLVIPQVLPVPAAPPVSPTRPPEVTPAPAAPAAPAAKTITVADDDSPRRYLIPASGMSLQGEYDRQRWSVYLTQEQASAAARFHLAFQNSIVTAPEASTLTVLVNDRPLVQTAIDSADSVRALEVTVPPDLLQTGSNLVEIRVAQRHRTDCDIRSTYDLWTAIKPEETYLTFRKELADTQSVSEAIKAIGVDATGRTVIRIVAPAMGQTGTTDPLLKLSQGLSLMAGMPNLSFDFGTAPPEPGAAGEMTIYIGTFSELQPFLPSLSQATQSGGITGLVRLPGAQRQSLIISGPSWSNISGAIDTVFASTVRPAGMRRDVIATQRWSAPDAPLMMGGETMSLSQLGLQTQELSGRRMRMNMNIAVPADFYASAYGQAELLLDAAFTESVQPGSHIDVYVNDNVASSTPMYARKGGIFRHLPIKIPLRHIRPGVNSITIEVALVAKEDAACTPGTPASKTPRFALFDTSELVMPKFARIGQSPNLSALVGTGFPYSRLGDEPVILAMDRLDGDTLSVAATFLGRVSMMGGRIVKTGTVASQGSIGDRDTLFISPISQIPQKVLQQVNLSLASATAWHPAKQAPGQSTPAAPSLDEWSSKVSGGAWRGQFSFVTDWLKRNFDMSFDSFQLSSHSEPPFQPTASQTFILAQAIGAAGTGTWTVLTAPDSARLKSGTEAISRQENWQKTTGRLVAYNEKTQAIASLPVTGFTFIDTAPSSLNNYRLVLANWLSSNFLIYAILLALLLTVLGALTSFLLSRSGRPK